MTARKTGVGPAPARGPLAALKRRFEPAIAGLRGSDTAKASALAVAMIVNNVIALGSTFVFARLIGDYGSLAALVKYLLILTVVGQAMQVATAREGVLGHLGVGEGILTTVAGWAKSMLFVTAALTVVSIVFRSQIAELIGVKHDAWAAATGLPAGCVYLQLCLMRGALQGIGDYRSVGISLVAEQGSRLVLGALLAVVGLNLTGAYLGSLLSYIAMALYCANRLRVQLLGKPAATVSDTSAVTAQDASRGMVGKPAIGLWAHVKGAWVPIAGLAVIAVLQNIDVIAAKHRFPTSVASSYAATSVAAQVLIWVAMGAGYYLVPEVSRRRAAGQDTRGVLLRALGIIGVCAIPCLLIFAVASHLLLEIAFSAKRATASSSLLPLGAAFTVLAATYLAVQYMLAMKRKWFLVPLGAVAVLEPILLLHAPRHPAGFAVVVLAVQALGAIVAFTVALRGDAKAVPAVNPELASSPPAQRGAELA